MTEKSKDYNKPLRSSILICSLRCEETASSIIRNLLRVVKPESKTLGNKSSSLSFKNKIDLLYDIDDLSIDEYSMLLKFMEIRNQFIHNGECNSFVDLAKANPDLTKYLKAKFPNDIKVDEDCYFQSFKELFRQTLVKLIVLKLEYRTGQTLEMHRYVDAKTLENFKEIYKAAFEKWKTAKAEEVKPFVPFFETAPDTSEQDIVNFEFHLELSIIDEKIKIFDAICNQEVTDKHVFQRRASLLENLKKEKAEAEKNVS
jgi:hypothetical protein